VNGIYFRGLGLREVKVWHGVSCARANIESKAVGLARRVNVGAYPVASGELKSMAKEMFPLVAAAAFPPKFQKQML
jgi:hypothetical protein